MDREEGLGQLFCNIAFNIASRLCGHRSLLRAASVSMSSPELSSTQNTFNAPSDNSRPLSLLDQPGNKVLMQLLVLEDLGKFVMPSIDVVHLHMEERAWASFWEQEVTQAMGSKGFW